MAGLSWKQRHREHPDEAVSEPVLQSVTFVGVLGTVAVGSVLIDLLGDVWVDITLVEGCTLAVLAGDV